jgi:hypothetical protein
MARAFAPRHGWLEFPGHDGVELLQHLGTEGTAAAIPQLREALWPWRADPRRPCRARTPGRWCRQTSSPVVELLPAPAGCPAADGAGRASGPERAVSGPIEGPVILQVGQAQPSPLETAAPFRPDRSGPANPGACLRPGPLKRSQYCAKYTTVIARGCGLQR